LDEDDLRFRVGPVDHAREFRDRGVRVVAVVQRPGSHSRVEGDVVERQALGAPRQDPPTLSLERPHGGLAGGMRSDCGHPAEQGGDLPDHGTRPTAHVQDLTVASERVGHQGDVVALEPTLARSFAGARHLRSITPPPTLPYGVNMDFHLLLLT
jgi:hypothetical protein